jgi:hypothetical protein
MTNKQIIEYCKTGVFHPGFAWFQCKELDKFAVRRLPLDTAEKLLALSELKMNKIPLDGNELLIK